MYFHISKQRWRQCIYYSPRITCLRYKSYKETLNSPIFPIPIRANYQDHTEPSQIPGIDLYKKQLHDNDQSKPWFILHDGPPYANGSCHVGHALNKILKDITVRHKLLSGHRVHFQPGWDCHGLPIELQAQTTIKNHRKDLCMENPLHVRDIARQEISRWRNVQYRDFLRWGIVGSWEDAYLTMNPATVARQLRVFQQLHFKKLIAYEEWPVYWSYSSGTALAEAELEYHEDHVSPSLYVALRLCPEGRANLLEHLGMSRKLAPEQKTAVSLVVWTTTPWTLPSNEAVAISSELSYTCLGDPSEGQFFLVSTQFVETFLQLMSSRSLNLQKFQEVSGAQLNGLQLRYQHPFQSGKTCPVLLGSHVTEDKGTGMVHVAPGHGKDDFLLGRKHNLPLADLVDLDARFKPAAGPALSGLFILKEGNSAVIDALTATSSVLHVNELRHSYPYDWRKRQPVIQMASKQWFIDTSQLAQRALESYASVSVHPNALRPAMLKFISERPKWCISRQRVWGAPIPVIFHGTQPIVDECFISHIAKRIESEKDYDFWWKASHVGDLLPQDLAQQLADRHDVSDPCQLRLSRDIFDIWMDSGLTWLSVLPEVTTAHDTDLHVDSEHRTLRPADLYLEGLDQFRGWFSSSLLMGVALTGRSPFKSLAVHGFTTDAQGRKMSKSLGNVVSPELVKEKYGGWNTLRYWVAMSGLSTRPTIGPHALEQHLHQWTSLRNTFRFLLGNLHDFSSVRQLSFSELEVLDRMMLLELAESFLQARRNYDAMQYDEALNAVEKIQARLSTVYLVGVKDRLYCSPRYSSGHCSAQTTMFHLHRLLSIMLHPIMPHLIQEIISSVEPHSEQTPVWLNWNYGEQLCHEWMACHEKESWSQSATQIFTHCLDLRQTVLQSVAKSDGPESQANGRKASQVNPLADVWLFIHEAKSDTARQCLQWLQEEPDSCHSALCEVLRCSRVVVSGGGQMADDVRYPVLETTHWRMHVERAPVETRCARCRRYTCVKEHERNECLCELCSSAIRICGQDSVTSGKAPESSAVRETV